MTSIAMEEEKKEVNAGSVKVPTPKMEPEKVTNLVGIFLAEDSIGSS